MKLTLLGLSAFVQLASCWPVQVHYRLVIGDKCFVFFYVKLDLDFFVGKYHL